MSLQAKVHGLFQMSMANVNDILKKQRSNVNDFSEKGTFRFLPEMSILQKSRQKGTIYFFSHCFSRVGTQRKCQCTKSQYTNINRPIWSQLIPLTFYHSFFLFCRDTHKMSLTFQKVNAKLINRCRQSTSLHLLIVSI